MGIGRLLRALVRPRRQHANVLRFTRDALERRTRPGPGVMFGLLLLRVLEVGSPAPTRSTLLRLAEHQDVAESTGTFADEPALQVSSMDRWDAVGEDSPADRDAARPARSTRPTVTVRWSVLRDVVINDTTLVRQGRMNIVASGALRDVDDGLRIKGPAFRGHHGDRAIARIPSVDRTITEGIRVCGFGSRNWYHWLVEILPTATAVDRLPTQLRGLPLLVPEVLPQRDAWTDSLRCILPDHDLVAVPREHAIRVESLVWLDPAVAGVRTFNDGHRPALDRIRPSPSLLGALRRRVLDRLGIDADVEPSRLVMLHRPPELGRAANTAELESIAQENGFEVIDPGTLRFRDQVELFAHARVIAGGWGAAWSSMLFCSPDTRALMWAPSYFNRWPLFANLAEVSGMRLGHLFVDTSSTTFGEANAASQQVPPEEFRSALVRMLAR